MNPVALPEDSAAAPAQPDPAAEAPPPTWRRWSLRALWATRAGAAASTAFVAVLVYVGSFWNGFAYDDAAIIPGDPRVTHFKLLEIFTLPYWRNSPDLALYRPFTTLSFAVDWFVSRGYAWYFHAINTAEHAAATAVVALLLAELFPPSAAFAGALLFALHPVHVEAVANLVGRAEVVSAIFYLGAILIWVRGGSRPKPWRVAGVVGCYIVALLHKESSATLPAALVLFDAALGRWSLRPLRIRDYLRRVLPLLAVMAVVLAGFLALHDAVVHRMSPDVLDPTFDLPMSRDARTITALQAWPIFLRLLFFPTTLLPEYGPRILMPQFGWNAAALVGLVLLTAVVVAGLVALVRGRGRTALGLLWFPLTILPVSNLLFPIGVIVAERTLYAPMLALCILAAAVVQRATSSSASAGRLAAAGVAIVAALFAVRTVTRVPDWESTDRLFYQLHRDRPESFRGWWHLARIARRDPKQKALEITRYETALRLWPYRRSLVVEAISQELSAGRREQAHKLASFAVKRWPEDVNSQRLLAGTALDMGDTATARTALRAGLTLAPRDTLLLRMAHAILPDYRPPATPPGKR